MPESPASPFVPLSYEVLASLSAPTRKQITMDFIAQGNAGRVRSILPLIPFLTQGSWQLDFDRDLASAVCMAISSDGFPEALETIKTAYAQLSTLQPQTPPLDLGPAFVRICSKLNTAHAIGNAADLDDQRQKLLTLLAEPGVLLAAARPVSYYDRQQDPAGFSFIPAWLSPESLVSPAAAAYGLSEREPELWASLMRRPEWIARLHKDLYPKEPHPAVGQERPPALFTLANGWLEKPALIASLLSERLAERALLPEDRRPLIDHRAIAHALFPANQAQDMSARQSIWRDLGPAALSILMGRSGASPVRQSDWTATRLTSSYDKLRSICPLPGETEAVAKTLFHEVSLPWLDTNALRWGLFSTDPKLREATRLFYKPLPPKPDQPAPGPYEEIITRHGARIVLGKAAGTNDPSVMLSALEAMGAEAFRIFPGDRKGLDPSALMIVAQQGSLEVFEAALQWADSHGVLDECADAKAWVMNEENTRKKGDLLACCVALADLDKAEALLSRRPNLKLTSARDTAKAMGSKLRSEKAGRAVSAWESLLFSKSIEIKAAPDTTDEPLAPPPPRNRSRL